MPETGPTKPSRSRRVSLTDAQRASAAGAELLSLLQFVTDDGSLSADEIEALRAWLADGAATELPAHDFLAKTVTEILADGIVTEDERRALFLAIEKVLPPDIRDDVRGKRMLIERAERQRNAPIGSWNFMVAGVRYEGRPAVIQAHANPDDKVFLARDTANRYSRNAVEIRLKNGMLIGYVPESDAREVAPLLDEGSPHDAWITKILGSARNPIPVVQVKLYTPDATVDGLSRAGDVPNKVASRKASSGCASVILVAGTGVLALAALVGAIS
jgi:HIRAN domain